MTKRKKKPSFSEWWGGLSTAKRAAFLAGASVELALTTVALADLAKRPADQVRGPKALWGLGSFVQPVGPVAYLAYGRRA